MDRGEAEILRRDEMINEIHKIYNEIGRLECLLNNAIEKADEGEWVEVEVLPEVYDIEGVRTWGSKMQCAKCGFIFTAIEGHITQHNFCPHCGKKMKTCKRYLIVEDAPNPDDSDAVKCSEIDKGKERRTR